MGLSNSRRVPRTVTAAAILVVLGIPVAWGAAALVTGASLSDLQPAAASAFDGASAKVTVVSRRDSTTTVLRVHGVGAAAVGKTYGAHLHEGMCVAGDGGAAGGHYNHTKILGDPITISAQTEVWLDVTIDETGRASCRERV